jgi:hypothetical protein
VKHTLLALCGPFWLAAELLSGCARPDVEMFVDRYRLQTNVGPLYELVADGRTVGWLYGAVHYGTEERPSMSPAAVRAMAQTRHVYLEQTDRAGTSWAMRGAIVEDLPATTRARRQAAMTSADTIRQQLIAAKKMEKESPGAAVGLSQDPAYWEAWTRANNYCGVFDEYGTERLARAFATGKEITIHPLETAASRQAALDESRAGRCRGNAVANTAAPADPPFPETLDAICKAILHDA